jgi:hypothetical protein
MRKRELHRAARYLPMLLIVLLVNGSCTKRDLEAKPTEGKVSITFNWKNLLSGESVPVGMRLYFYGSDGTTITKDCTGTAGFSGTLPNGTYQVLAYNTDANGVSYEGMDQYATATVVTSIQTKSAANTSSSASSKGLPATRSATYLVQPGHVYAVGLGTITVSGLKEQGISLTATPLTLVRRADIKIKLTGQTTAVASCTETIDGITQKVNLTTGAVDATTTGMISYAPSAVTGGYESVVTFFGKAPSAKNILTVVCNFTGGGSQIIPTDITTALNDLSDTVVEIQLNITIDITGTTPGNFQATLKDWRVENRNVVAQ